VARKAKEMPHLSSLLTHHFSSLLSTSGYFPLSKAESSAPMLDALGLSLSLALTLVGYPAKPAPVVADLARQTQTVMDASEESTAMHIGSTDPAHHMIGVYMNAPRTGDTDFLKSTIAGLKDASGSAIVFDVKGPYVYFDTKSRLALDMELKEEHYKLADVMKIVKDANVYAIARYVAIKDEGLTDRIPYVQMEDEEGNTVGKGWIDPMDPTARKYNMQLLCEVAKSGVDEINLDYIRFTTADVHGLRILTGDEKADRVEDFLKDARTTVKRCGKDVKLGASTYAILGWDYDINNENLGQDVKRFAPLLDVISPMAYPDTFSASFYNAKTEEKSRMYTLVYTTLTGYQEFLGPQAWKLRPWIQGYRADVQAFQDQMDAVGDAGICGFTIWNANSNYETFYEALKTWKKPEGCT
jgi:hypothetical protein